MCPAHSGRFVRVGSVAVYRVVIDAARNGIGLCGRERAIYYYIDAIQNTRYMDTAELSLLCGVILAVLVIFVVFVG